MKPESRFRTRRPILRENLGLFRSFTKACEAAKDALLAADAARRLGGGP